MLQSLYSLGSRLMSELNNIIDAKCLNYLRVIGHPSRSLLTINHESYDGLLLRSILQQEMVRRGVLWQGQFVISFSHTEEDVRKTCSAFKESLGILEAAIRSNSPEQFLLGKQVAPVFRTQTAK